MHENSYNRYPESFITSMVSLQNLTIDVYEGFKFGRIFQSLRNLRRIDFNPRSGSIFRLQNDSFTGLNNSKIHELNMQFRGYVSDVDANLLSPFHHISKLTFTVGSLCGIRKVLKALHGLRGKSMEYLDLSYNYLDPERLTALTDNDIQYLSTMCVKKVDLSSCALSSIPYKISVTRFARCLEEISIGRNHFQAIDSLPAIAMLSYANLTLFDFSSFHPMAEKNDIDDILTGSIFSLNRTIEITIYFTESLRLLNLSKAWISNGNPLSNIYFHVVAKGLKIADLSYLGFPFCQKNSHLAFSTSIRSLSLSGWRCADLNVTFLSSIKTLETLIFQDSGLAQGFQNDHGGILFKGLYQLSNLDLGSNNLQNLSRYLFEDQAFSLRNLYLQNNVFRNIPGAILKIKHLKLLNLQNNKLSTLSELDTEILEASHETIIKISRNPFDCSCQNLHMVRWLKKNEKRIQDFKDISCIGGVNLKNITNQIRYFELNCLGSFWLEFSASLCIILILAIIASAICYRYRVYIQYLYLIAVSSRPNAEQQNDNYDFDGFISYSNRDYDWVLNILYKHFTEDMNMSICVHDKDFIPGRSIANEILRCIDQSRKVIFVVTRSFLESDWGNYELELARIHAFRSGRSGLLIILKDELLIQEMPELLKKMWWKIVCMKWPNAGTCEDHQLFWHNLKLAMEE